LDLQKAGAEILTIESIWKLSNQDLNAFDDQLCYHIFKGSEFFSN